MKSQMTFPRVKLKKSKFQSLISLGDNPVLNTAFPLVSLLVGQGDSLDRVKAIVKLFLRFKDDAKTSSAEAPHRLKLLQVSR